MLILSECSRTRPPPANLTAAPENVSADLDVLLLVRAATLRSISPVSPPSRRQNRPEDHALAETTGEPVAHIAALREAVEETGLDRWRADPRPAAHPAATHQQLHGHSRHRLVEQPCACRSQDYNESASSPACPCVTCSPRQPAHRLRQTRGRTSHRTPPSRCPCPAAKNSPCGFTAILLDRSSTRLDRALGYKRCAWHPATRSKALLQNKTPHQLIGEKSVEERRESKRSYLPPLFLSSCTVPLMCGWIIYR